MKRISVTIPVYNEIKFIQKTLESVIGDADEIIIGDNASTDGTSDICQSFANRYPEIKYTRHKENMGASGNGRFINNQITGKYVRKMGGHDMISIGSNHSMANILDKNLEAVMVYPNYIIALNKDYSFRYFYLYDDLKKELVSDSIITRLNCLVTNCWCDASFYFGLYRTDVYNIVRYPRIFQNSNTDRILLLSFAAKGKMLADEKSIFFRMYPREDKQFEEEKRRVADMVLSPSMNNKNPGFWNFSIIAGHYDLFIENFGENNENTKYLFNNIINNRIEAFNEYELTMEGMPPVVPGKEKFCNDLMVLLKKKYNENKDIERKKNLERSFIHDDNLWLDSIESVKGFSKDEDWGTWTDGFEAEISFYMKNDICNKDINIELKLKAFLNNDGRQAFEIFANANSIGKYEINNGDLSDYLINIPSNLITNENKIEVKFVISFPTSPLELKISNDNRKLGLGFVSFSIYNER